MGNCDTCPSKGNCNTNAEACGIQNNPNNKIKNIIGVMSGKGGVGKSTMTTLIAKQLNAQGYKVGILDADITGPSIPRLMRMGDVKAFSDGTNIIPVTTSAGIKVISLNLMLEDENSPVIWRGPMIGGVVKQFYTDVLWEELDYLLIDMPPGTGDVALTVMQSIPITGVVMVSMPQNLVSMIVSKAINMTQQLNVPVIGIIENMSYIQCPNCSEKIRMFDDDDINNFLDSNKVELLGELPMSKEIIKISTEGVGEISPDLKGIIEGITSKVESFCANR
ncbi:Chromosome partitioning ATPase, Mrp family, contains Fe-S cluster [Peptostreptococcus russellii]|uniref:Iron-sulfur cluster carrier protein n=2 Tax=Peptostreptococcus russellii TaxID=215200 RepID=A0A1H8EUB0_9FIRM|nr:Mrp/NBP35 family ATP-binding protein [Peptostreptococcus russellii]SEN23201.1 Chromosome partitioning ATPase, Mrp family, contains Fe-S cluster [Peptostreptococcus russellii]